MSFVFFSPLLPPARVGGRLSVLRWYDKRADRKLAIPQTSDKTAMLYWERKHFGFCGSPYDEYFGLLVALNFKNSPLAADTGFA